jgi:hypothetical protein
VEPLTIADVRALPATVDLLVAARALGIGRTRAYELAQRHQFPCPVRRDGRRYRVQTANLLKILDIDDTPTAGKR